MKPSIALLVVLLLLVLSACGGGDGDNLNAEGDPLGAGSGLIIDGDTDASGVRAPDDGANSDDIFGGDVNATPGADFTDEEGDLFPPETGQDATGG